MPVPHTSRPRTPLEKTATDSDASPQPEGQGGVSESMGTLALHSGLIEAASCKEQGVSMSSFAGLDDATIMLQLRAGNMDAFDTLLAKYRKPIIHFMYRMVRNQAITEELAQEVFLRV